MKRIWLVLVVMVAMGLPLLAGCNKGTRVHSEEETRTEQTRPVVVPDAPK